MNNNEADSPLSYDFLRLHLARFYALTHFEDPGYDQDDRAPLFAPATPPLGRLSDIIIPRQSFRR